MGVSMASWQTQKIFCNCAKCKGAIIRMRRITRQHIEEYGLWEGSSRHHSSDDDNDEDINEEVRRNALETMPHYSVVGGCQRRTERVHQEELQSHVVQQPSFNERAHEPNEDVVDNQIEDEHMEEMIHDFFGAHVPTNNNENNERDETPLQDAAKTPLYEGSQYSILRACLELLNLQTMYGWSNASVTSLLK